MNGLGTIGQQRAEEDDETKTMTGTRIAPRAHEVPNPDDLQPEREDPKTKPVERVD